MKRVTFGLLALVLLASSSGCCCIDRFFCWGCRGQCAYGNEGPCNGSSCGGGGCGSGQCADCGGYSGAAAGQVPGPSAVAVAKRHPAQGHPHVRQRRDSGGEYEFAAGPPTGGVSYPYYTNRGPRDFLARNPRSIGP